MKRNYRQRKISKHRSECGTLGKVGHLEKKFATNISNDATWQTGVSGGILKIRSTFSRIIDTERKFGNRQEFNGKELKDRITVESVEKENLNKMFVRTNLSDGTDRN